MRQLPHLGYELSEKLLDALAAHGRGLAVSHAVRAGEGLRLVAWHCPLPAQFALSADENEADAFCAEERGSGQPLADVLNASYGRVLVLQKTSRFIMNL